MRVNLPVSNVEYPINDDTLILSTTDTKGRITYVNRTFIEVSGFTEEELIGKAHNIVRHPDMPPEAFEDLWNSMKLGLPWTGLVKNRRKNGDFYWVIGNATPLIENGKITGYLSVRTKPPRELIEKVAPIYRKVLEGKAGNLKIEKGQVVRTDLLGRILSFFHMTVSKRIALFTGIPILFLLAVGGTAWSELSQLQSSSWIANTIAATTISSVAIMLFLGYCMSQNIILPLRKAIAIANALAAGDLQTKKIDNRTDEFGQLIKTLNQTGINLRATVLDVKNNALSVSHAAHEIASGNMDLSQRTEEQASSLEETAASMEELTSTVRQNTDNSIQANQLAITASEITTKGGNMMNEVVQTMSSISESSNKIAEIISVIDGIAFQTNILALNAAVEAARAGEQGRGFAVVASEVRNLAGRSALAAKEIKGLIGESVGNVKDGCQLVEQAGSTMDEIVVHVRRVADLMREIATVGQEQGLGIEQVSEAVSQMDIVTQQNAALVEESAAAAKSIEHQAGQLLETVSTFKLEAGHRLNYHSALAGA